MKLVVAYIKPYKLGEVSLSLHHVAGLSGINVQVGRFAVEHVCAASEGNDFRFILFIEPGIDNVGELLPA